MYLVTVDASGLPLSDIERGNPRRVFSQPTLYGAVQIGNAFLLGAGEAMRQGPRALKPGATWAHHARVSIRRDA